MVLGRLVLAEQWVDTGQARPCITSVTSQTGGGGAWERGGGEGGVCSVESTKTLQGYRAGQARTGRQVPV